MTMNQNNNRSVIIGIIIVIASGALSIISAGILQNTWLKLFIVVITNTIFFVVLTSMALKGVQWLKRRDNPYIWLFIIVIMLIMVMTIRLKLWDNSSLSVALAYASLILMGFWMWLIKKCEDTQRENNRANINNPNSSESIGD